MDIMKLLNALPSAVSQGLIWGLMGIGVYISYKILDIADLTVDGTMCTGGAVFIMATVAGCSVPVALLLAFLAVRGTVGEDLLPAAQLAAAAAAVLPGGMYAAGKWGSGALWGALATAGGLIASLALMGLVCFERVMITPSAGHLAAAILAGGLAAGILRTSRKPKRKRETKKRKKTIGKIHEFI